MSKTTKELIGIIKKTSEQGTKPIDTQAEVIRVEDNTVWVHIPGGIDETPAQKTINANVGDIVQVRIANGDAWLVGNGSAPPTDDAKAIEAIEYSRVAAIAAEDAQIAAGTAKSAAENAVTMAGRAQQAATDAERDAGIAKNSADSALTQLAYVEDVVGVLNWIAEHGDYDPTQDTEVQSGKMYFARTGSGTEQDPYVYSLVENPTGDPSAQGWYELTGVDEAIANYVSTHLVLLDDGLYIIKDNSGYKLKLTDYGSYIIAPDGTTIVNQNTADGNIIRAIDGTVIAHLGYGEGTAQSGTSTAPYYNFGIRKPNTIVGNYSVAEGNNTTASGFTSHAEGSLTTTSGFASHAEGEETTASGLASHAEGILTTASGQNAHAEGYQTTASGLSSHSEGTYTTASGESAHAQNFGTVAGYDYQTAVGKYNENKQNNAFEIGNGAGRNAEHNAFEVTWEGDVIAAGEITDGAGNSLSEIKFKAGDAISGVNGLFSGYVVSNQVYFFVPLPKIIDTGVTAAMEKKAMLIRGTLGYIDDSYNDTTVGATSDYTWFNTVYSNGIMFRVQKETGGYTNASNNTPISVRFRTNADIGFN